MRQYLDLLREVLDNGVVRDDRTGTGTRSVFGRQLRYDLADGFPALTTKRLHLRSIIVELLWLLRGEPLHDQLHLFREVPPRSASVDFLHQNKVTIWDEWVDKNGGLGPVYGVQWRSWLTPHGRSIDQITRVVDRIRSDPNSRRLIVSAWNVADVDSMVLPPCHTLFQFYVANGRLSCQLYQRSGDLFLGVPFNIASYALLLMMVAQVCDLEPGELVHTFGDAHLYSNHVDQAREQLTREPRALPRMWLNPEVRSIFDFTLEDVKLLDYDPHPSIRAAVSV